MILSTVLALLIVGTLSWYTFHDKSTPAVPLTSSSRELSLAVVTPTAPTSYPSPIMEINRLPQHLPTITPLPTPISTPLPSPTPTPTYKPKPSPHTVRAVSVSPVVSHGTLFAESNPEIIRKTFNLTTSHPDDARRLTLLSVQPQAKWFGEWNSAITSDVNNYVTTATQFGNIPVIVTYNIPYRDCSGFSAGGADSENTYLSWIRGVAQGIQKRTAWVILEPDSLALIDCLRLDQQNSRISLLRQAASILTTNGAQVYLDAGHPGWIPADQIARRLVQAGILSVQGFSLNVSNFSTTDSSTQYGQAISSLVGGKHFVIDTSRNGNGPTPDFEWCNPLGRAIGSKPTTKTGNPLIDALLWVKHPGESDGTCNGGPSAGNWWPEYALGLLKNAGW